MENLRRKQNVRRLNFPLFYKKIRFRLLPSAIQTLSPIRHVTIHATSRSSVWCLSYNASSFPEKAVAKTRKVPHKTSYHSYIMIAFPKEATYAYVLRQSTC